MIRTAAFVCLLLLAVTASARASVMLVEAHVGKHDRIDPIITLPLSGEWASAARLRVETTDGDKPVTLRAQVVKADGKAALVWIAPGVIKAGESRRFYVKHDAPRKSEAAYVSIDNDEKRLALSVNGQSVLHYQMATVQPPDGVKPVFARSAYIHPVKTPAGLLVTNDFPEKHLHHHGIWFPWTETVFEGRKTDFWNMGKGEGTVEFVRLDGHADGDVFASFRVQQRHVALKTAKGRKDVLNETWDIRLYGNDRVRLFDMTSTQTCAGDSPLTLKLYHYGGLGVRGSADWEGEGDACRFLTSEGKTRIEGHATAAKWCIMSGKIGGKPAGIAILCHPENFRFPQKMRIHPGEPFFNYAPEQDGDFTIEPGKPYVSRYRFVAFDGEPDAKMIEALWNDYASPIEAKRVK